MLVPGCTGEGSQAAWNPVTTWPGRAGAVPICTVPVCSLASASGTTFSKPEVSTTAKPMPRRADR